MKIRIDNREEELIKTIKILIENTPSFKDIQFVIEALPLGDIIIFDEDIEKIIIERKTINDLLSSIKDGRYEEQSYRLNGINHHNHNIMYLIEGDINKINNRFKDNKIEKSTLYSAILSLNYYKGFSVIRTFSIEETAYFICNAVNKLKKCEIEKKKPFYYIKNEQPQIDDKNDVSGNIIEDDNNNTNDQNDKNYVNVIKKVKKENISPNNIGEIMLCQIPGISSVTSLAIMNKFKTIKNLLTNIQIDNNCLNDITIENNKGQHRKISKTCISNIYKFLLIQ